MDKALHSNIDKIINTCKDQGYFPIPFNLGQDVKEACRVAEGLRIIRLKDGGKSYKLDEVGSKILLDKTTSFNHFTQERKKDEISFMQLKYWFWILLIPIVLSGIVSFIVAKLTS